MSKNTILAYTNNPAMGLGNRVTLICAGYAAAKVSGSNFIVKWNRGRGCDAEWNDLFKPPTKFELVEHNIPTGSVMFNQPSFKSVDRHKEVAGDQLFSTKYWDAYKECAYSFQLIDELALPICDNFIAVSIRANWSFRAPPSDWSDGLRLPENAFLCSDSKTAFEIAKKVEPSLWSLSKPTVNEDMANRDYINVQAAARDMFMLTRASVILGIGHESTFRNLAVIGYQVPIFKLSKDYTP